jgi:hypothetical protein
MTPGYMMSMRKAGLVVPAPVDLVNLTIDHRAGKAGGQTASCCLLVVTKPCRAQPADVQSRFCIVTDPERGLAVVCHACRANRGWATAFASV